MNTDSSAARRRFCWFDLATSDAPAAAAFYRELFGWQPSWRPVGSGRIGRFVLEDAVVASFYQLSRRHLADGVPSHWTPYVGVADTNRAARRAAELGANVLVEPFDVPGTARIALLADTTGALFGVFGPTADAARPTHEAMS